MKETLNKSTKNAKVDSDSSPVRVSKGIKSALEKEVENLKKIKKGSGKITPCHIIAKVLPLLTEKHRAEILSQTVTGEDREKEAFKNYLKKHKGTKKCEFKDLLLYGEINIDDYLPPQMRRVKKTAKSNNLQSA